MLEPQEEFQWKSTGNAATETATKRLRKFDGKPNFTSPRATPGHHGDDPIPSRKLSLNGYL